MNQTEKWAVPFSPAGSRASSSIEKIIATLRQWRRRIKDRGDLAALSDRMLEDIGITRADAELLAKKSFWKE